VVSNGWGNTPWGGTYILGVTPGVSTDYGLSGWGNEDWEWATLPSWLQIINPDDVTQVLYDLNDTLGTSSALYGSVRTDLLSDVDMGAPKLDGQALDVSRALGFNRSATAEMKFKLRIHGDSYDNVRLAVSVLGNHFARGCTMLFKPNGSSQTNYIDILPSTTPVLLNGQQLGMFQATVLFDSPDGIEISLQRVGYIRRDKLDPTLNKLLNPTMLRDSDANGTPDNWAKDGAPTLSIVSATESLHVVSPSNGVGVIQTMGAATASPGQIWTISGELKVTSGSAVVGIQWFTSGAALISAIASTGYSTNAWTRVSISGTAPATTDHIVAQVAASGGAATFDVRNVQLELASAATQFRVPAQTMNVDPTATPFAQFMPVYNPSDAPAPCEITVAFPDASSKIVEVDYALISDKGVVGSRALSDFLNGPNYAQAEATGNGWTVVHETGTSSVGDVNASGGNTAQTTHNTDPLQAGKRTTWTRTTLLDALRGRWKVYARVRGNDARKYDMQLRWGAGTVAGNSNDVVVHDTSNVLLLGGENFHYVYIDLGDIELPQERNIAIGQLTLELWTWLESGAASHLDNDHLVFVPTDDTAIATVPPGADLSTTGKALVSPPQQMGAPASDPAFSAGDIKGSAIRLNANNEAAGWGSNTNGIYTGVANTIRVFYFDVTAHVGAGGSIDIACEIANLSTTTKDRIVAPTISKSQRQTYVLTLPDVATKKYQPRVRVTARTSPAYVDVEAITMFTLSYVPQNGKVRTDPGSMPSRAAVEQLDSSGNLGLTMDATGTPFWLPPGLALLYVNAFDVPTDAYNENKSDLTTGAKRTFTVTPTIYPRHWQ
jgi:hypothetical protein